GYSGGADMTWKSEPPPVDGAWAWVLSVRRPGMGLAVAVGGVLLGLAVRSALEPLLGDRVAFLFLVPAVVAAAALGGLWTGLLASVLGAAGGLYLTWSMAEHTRGDGVSALVFLAL